MIKIYKKRLKLLPYLIACLCFVLICLVMVNQEDLGLYEVFFAYLGIFFFGFGLLLFSYQFFDPRPAIVISKTDFRDYTSGIFFHLKDLEDCSNNIRANISFLNLKINSDRYGSFLRAWYFLRRRFGNGWIDINLMFIDVEPDNLEDLLKLLSRIDEEQRGEALEAFGSRVGEWHSV